MTENNEPLDIRGVLYVHIIESPSPADLLDGRTEGSVLQRALQLAEIPVSYNLAVNRTTLETSLSSRVREAMRIFKAPPILHFSMHGSREGLQLTSGDLICWSELARLIEELVEPETGPGLIGCMSSCFGIFAREMESASGSPPYYVLLGHPEKMDWADAAIGFTALYHRLFKGVPHFYIAVNAMREASGDDRFDHTSWFEEQHARQLYNQR